MCIKLINSEQEIPYDISKPLEEQIKGCKQIVVNYEPFDKSVDKFLQEIERFAKTGVDAKLSIKVIHNDHLSGSNIKRKIKKATNGVALNEIIKLIVLSQIETDKKLEELANNFVGMVK